MQLALLVNAVGLARHMGVGFGQKAAGAAGGIEHRLANLRVDPFDHEPDDGARRVEFAAIARHVAHLAEQRLV